MNVKIALLSIALITTTLIACEFGVQVPTDGDSPESNADPEPIKPTQSKQRWFSDSRPAQLDIDSTIDFPGVAVKAKDDDAVLFASCDLDFAAIDWPNALLLGSLETVNTTERFGKDNEVKTYSFEWYGSIISRKRVVRQEPLFRTVSTEDRLNTQDFIREFPKNEQLEIAHGGNQATFGLAGFEEAFVKHCS